MQSQSNAEQIIQAIRESFPLIERLANNARTHYTGIVRRERIILWLLQFGDVSLIRLASRLLEGLHFVDELALCKLLRDGFEKLPIDVQHEGCIVPIGRSFDSASAILYPFSKSLGWDESQTARRFGDFPAVLSSQPSSVVFVDDNITSGTQLVRFLAEMRDDFEGHREHFEHPLDPELLEQFRKTPTYVLVALELGDGREYLRKHAHGDASPTIVSGAVNVTRWLEFGASNLWSNEEEAVLIRQRLADVSRALFSDKKWTNDMLTDRLLGHGNLQRLTVFAHNTPKSVPAAFWKFGAYNGRPWLPLFPERSEWAKNEAAIREVDPMTLLAVERIIAEVAGPPKPMAHAGVVVAGKSVNSVEISVPSIIAAQRFAKSRTPHPAAQMNVPVSAQGLTAEQRRMLGPAFEFQQALAQAADGPTAADIDSYNENVKSYNDSLVGFQTSLTKSAFVREHYLSIDIRIHNRGQIPLREVFLLLLLPDSVNFSETRPSLPRAPKAPTKPKSRLSSLLASSLDMPPLSHSYIPRMAGSGYEPVKELEDEGRRVLRVHFGKIVPETFRDRKIQYLTISEAEAVIIPYKIVGDDLGRAIDGTFTLRLRADDAFEFSPD